MDEKILSCPFCGGWTICLHVTTPLNIPIYWIRCHDCESIGPEMYTRAEAINGWNQDFPRSSIDELWSDDDCGASCHKL